MTFCGLLGSQKVTLKVLVMECLGIFGNDMIPDEAPPLQVVAQTGQARTHRAPVWALMAVVGLFLMAHW